MAGRISDPPIRQTVVNQQTGLFTLPWLTWLRDLYVRVTRYIDSTFVEAGYGGIGIDASVNIGTISTSFVTLTGWDTTLVDEPKDVIQDLANNGLRLSKVGVWQFDVKLSIQFDEVNAGRVIVLRAWNDTKSQAGGKSFKFFVGRNQGGINMPVTINVDVDQSTFDIGDLIQLQVAADSGSADYTNSENIGSIIQAIHVSEKQG